MSLLEGGPIGGIRRQYAIPKRRMRPLYRLQDHRHLLEIIELAAEGQLIARQALLDHTQGLGKLARPVGRIDAEEADFERRNAAAHPQLEPSTAQLVEHADLFDEPDRMIERQ